ncbi:MAG: response regulator [Microcoleaceae cyanobacterium]
MSELLKSIFSPDQYMPHGSCYLWQSSLIWLHVISDLLIAIAYFSIPTMLVIFVCKRQDVPFLRVFLLFGLFIISCGLGHVIDVWTLWHPAYWLSGVERAFTALISCYTALELVTLLPIFLALKTPEQLAVVEAANQAKSEFLANMSHELRTPLNSILGFTSLIAEGSKLSPEHQKYIEIIHQSGQHLLNLINDILEMSKIEAGRILVQVEQFNLPSLLNSIEQMLYIKAEEKNLNFTVESDDDLPIFIVSDSKKIRQVLINLLGNAIKFTDSGFVTLRTKLVQDKTLSSEQVRLQFEVEDSGSGIAPTEIDCLFQPFVQTQSGLRQNKGTGLGLAISQKFIQLMGGEIQVESKLNQGSLFYFSIPVTVANINYTENLENPKVIFKLAPDQPKAKVLVVDDDYKNRLLLLQLLITVGFETQEASNGKEAIQQLKTWQPDLILMDLRMPIMDGYEATQYIKATASNPPPIIIALTAHVFEEEKQKIIEVGCDDLIRKPFKKEELLLKIANFLNLKYIYLEDQLETQKDNTSIVKTKNNISSSSHPITLKVMPQDWIEQLYQSASQCSDLLTHQLIEQIPQQYSSLAVKLTTLANEYRFDEIINWVEPYRLTQ